MKTIFETSRAASATFPVTSSAETTMRGAVVASIHTGLCKLEQEIGEEQTRKKMFAHVGETGDEMRMGWDEVDTDDTSRTMTSPLLHRTKPHLF